MTNLSPQEVKNRLSITQLLAYYKAKPANPNGLYYCISCKNTKPSLLATDANTRAKCTLEICKIKNADIFDIICIMEKCDFSQALVIADQVSKNINSSYLPNLLFDNSDKNILDDKNSIIPKLTEIKKTHINWLNRIVKVDSEWITFYFKVKGWYRHHIALPIDSNHESYAFIPLDKTKDHFFYRGKVRTAQIFPNTPIIQEKAKHIIICNDEIEVLRVSWELYRRNLLGDWVAITYTGNTHLPNNGVSLFGNFNNKAVKTIIIAFEKNAEGANKTLKLLSVAKDYFISSTIIVPLVYPLEYPEVATLTDYLDHNDIEKIEPFYPIKEIETPVIKQEKKNQNVLNRIVQCSIEIQMNEPTKMDFLHTVLCQVGMPRKQVNSRIFERRNGNASILLEAGRLWNGREWEEHPLPYGALPRLIMIYITSQAVITKHPIIETGHSLTEFMSKLGIDNSGGEKGRFKIFKKQLYALAASRLSLGMTIENNAVTIDSKPINKFLVWLDNNPDHPHLWSGYIELSNEFFNHLQNYVTPLDSRALASLKHSALALDIYTWLANRLYRIKDPKGILLTWDNLYEQFGQEYKQVKYFADEFQNKMNSVKLVYKNANIEVINDNRGYVKGYRFKPSPPPIAPNKLLKK